MIRAAVISLICLTQPVAAQDSKGLDFEMLRQSAPDLERQFPNDLVFAGLLARDHAYYEMSTVTSPVVTDISNFLVDDPFPKSDAFHRMVEEGLAAEFTHDELLALWFPIINFGNDCIGIDAAMETLIGKPVDEGTLQDFVTLMSLTVNPDEDITYPDRIDSGFRAMIDYGVSDEFITSAFAAPLLEGGPSRIISSNFCSL